MALIVDASVAVKWIVAEPLRDEALELVRQNDVVVPDLLAVEVRNALVNRVRRRLATAEEARRAASAFRAIPLIVEPSADRLDEAFDLALAFEHPIDDCIYLALAVVRQLTLVTADRRMFDLAQRRPDLQARVTLLA
ncbi:MAG TPA: type II toxin-antitoxin system VapC family toxin [Beijerinckiaceae bacterium]|nr:type II toxin-antitoxin system VapC family toxin [Beijerinckiaceae bacterium]